MAFDYRKEYKAFYMPDARRVVPEKWKTVIRHPMKKIL